MRAAIVIALTLLGFTCSPVQAQGQPPAPDRVVPHLKACTEWRAVNGNLYTRNSCDRLVTVQFMTLDDKHRIIRTLGRNEPLDTGIAFDAAKDLGWIGSSCPAGYKPVIELSATNKERFFNNDYACIRS